MEIIKGFERKTISWIINKRFRVYIFLILSLIFWFMPSTPYLNIIVNTGMSIFFIILAFLLLFDLSIKFIYLFIAFLFLTCLIYQLLNQVEKADILGNYIFAILELEVVIYLLKSYDDKKN